LGLLVPRLGLLVPRLGLLALRLGLLVLRLVRLVLRLGLLMPKSRAVWGLAARLRLPVPPGLALLRWLALRCVDLETPTMTLQTVPK
jgi:hypothetical protein